MPRFAGEVGYGVSVEAEPGVYVTEFVERRLRGNVEKLSRTLEEGSKVNDDISVGHTISVVADAYAKEHFMLIKYVVWAGVKWTVTSVTVQHPRLTLRLGGVFNG